MKNAVCIILGALFTLVCTSQEYIANRGLSFSYSSNNTWGIDMFGISGNNRFHLGYGHQFNGQEIKTVRNHKLVEEITENGDGEYFWVIDLGYSRLFKNRITAHSELSIGGKKKFTNYLSNTNCVDNYSLITDSKATMGMGLKVGYLLKNGLEPFIGIHTLKKLDFGLRLSW